MGVFDGNFAPGCEPGTDYPYVQIFQCMLERKNAITNEVLEPITFVLAYPLWFRRRKHFENLETKGAQCYFDPPPSNAALQRGITLAPLILSVPA
jgi:hypothetical protein